MLRNCMCPEEETQEEENEMDIRTDENIRAALKDADEKGKLDVVAAVTGIAGGVVTLREMMDSTEELSIMDRGMLGMHL